MSKLMNFVVMDYRVRWLLSTMQSGRQFGEEEQ